MKKILASILIASSCGVLAATSYPSLSHGVDLTKFKECQTYISNCPMTGPVRDRHCVKKTLDSHATTCHQTALLAKKTFVDASLISAKKMGNVTLLTLHYPADGQELYSIVSSDGQLINMNVDPRLIDKQFAKKYKNQKIFTTALNKPTYEKISDGAQQISLNVNMTKQCLACQSIGHATIKFNFDAKGKFIATAIHMIK